MTEMWGTKEVEAGRPPESGGYAVIAAAGIVIGGGCGWAIRRMVGSNQRRVRDLVTGEQREVVERLAELTGAVSDLRAQLVAQRGAPAGTRRPVGGAHVSSFQAALVQRAREDGIEQGFEIGYQAHLGECGVPYLPSRRRPRLTGDS
ncbi:hypothetical protein ACH4T9_20070 [Micromonospora sp. NPDC020750]|uniref:hypothetical protein n=1 Tax=unclassified Micromonospora TaxID=2617518 RepID=UPI00378DFBC5